MTHLMLVSATGQPTGVCSCPERRVPIPERRWVARPPMHAINLHVFCEVCGAQWSTYSAYARQVRQIEDYCTYIRHIVRTMVSLGQLERDDAEQRLLSIGVDWEGRRCTWHNVKTGHGWRCEREVPGALLTVQLKDRHYDREARVTVEVWNAGLDLDGTWATAGEFPNETAAKTAADALAP